MPPQGGRMPLLLEGITILDLTRLLPGPYGTMLLADLGAEVVKVEEPEVGDYAREFSPSIGGEGAVFQAVNRNKKSLAVNLKAEEGKAVFRRLCAVTDAVVEQFRPGVMDRLGLGWDALRMINPRLVYCALTGYGQDGPYRGRVGHDVNYIASGGILGLTGPEGGPPVLPGVQIADLSGGMMAAFGIVAALLARERTGEGRFVDVAMLDTVVSWLALPAAIFAATGEVPTRGRLFLSGGLPGYQVYETKDGRYITVGALEEKFWRNLCRALGREDLVPFAEPDEKKRQQMLGELGRLFKTKTRDEWIEHLADAEVCFAPVNDLAEAFADPQVLHRGMVAEVPLPDGTIMAQPGTPLRLSGGTRRKHEPPPTLGQHTASILSRAGYPAEEIAALRAAGVIR
jgi:crotonobetainyl-CoA:carnitine CoA-transferase CaiB-like acyl-CoA transferase